MPNSTSYDKQCSGKHAHNSEGKANAHVRHLIKIGKILANQMSAYYCCHCKHWHVGHKRKF